LKVAIHALLTIPIAVGYCTVANEFEKTVRKRR